MLEENEEDKVDLPTSQAVQAYRGRLIVVTGNEPRYSVK